MSKTTTRKAGWRGWVGLALFVAIALAWAIGARMLVTGESGRAASPLGGAFSLIDHRGQPRTDQDFLGAYMLVYFGYTHCPDVCPTSLQAVSDVLARLPAETAARIVPVMISVDPERDTPARMAEYVQLFHPGMVGLTGGPQAIRDVSEKYRVFATKAGEGADYLMDHTSLLYLMGPDGKFVERFPSMGEVDRMVDRIAQLVK